MHRREGAAEWLKDFLQSKSENKLQLGLKRILRHVSLGDLETASADALKLKYPHLAASLLSFPHINRTPYQEQVLFNNISLHLTSVLFQYKHVLQIVNWQENEMITYIDEDLLKLYLLMSGKMQLDVNGRTVFVCGGLNSLQVQQFYDHNSDAAFTC